MSIAITLPEAQSLSALPESGYVLMFDSSGAMQKLPVSALKSGIRTDLGVSKSKTLALNGGEWVRIAKTSNLKATFCGIIMVSHSWNSGRPVPLVCVVNGSSEQADGFNAENLTSGRFFSPGTSNQGASFTGVRFVKDTNAIYIEVHFKGNANTPAINYSLCGQINMDLMDAEISTATSASILKEISLS